ncbi:MAG: MgtC/SapB family protein [Taibaiella sp.]|nr:MgtC/SapB family protein [Taibaiella sp.]
MDWSSIFTEDVQKVLIAALLGMVIGLEREWSGKPAGLRTLILVCTGSALFTIVSYNIAELDNTGETDISRIASNIVTGIGFIGAGIIFKGKNNVHGLTTAATVWIAAAIGMAVGTGDYMLAVVATVAVWLILVVLQWVETGLNRISETLTYKVSFANVVNAEHFHYETYFNGKGYMRRETGYEKKGTVVTVHWTVSASRRRHAQAILRLLNDTNVIEMHYG